MREYLYGGHPAKVLELARDRLSLLLIEARVDHDMRTFAGQLQYGRTADIAPRSGDQRDLPFKLAHAPISPTMVEAEPASRTVFQNRAPAATLWSERGFGDRDDDALIGDVDR